MAKTDQSQNSKVVQIFDNSGNTSLYKKVSARVPDFLSKYGPDKGYRVLSTSFDYLETLPARKALLLELAKQGGQTELLKSALSEDKVVFQCQLADKEGNIVAQAAAVKRITFQKEFESGETAAFQRLMAKLGFGGEIFDIDEVKDMNSQDLDFSSEPPPAAPVIQVEAVDSQEETDYEDNDAAELVELESEMEAEQADIEEEDKPAVQEPVTTETVQQVTPAPVKRTASSTKQVDKEVLQPGLLRQLNQLAQVKQVKLPTVTTADELRSELSRLHKLPLPVPLD